jgi:hypothetical protein
MEIEVIKKPIKNLHLRVYPPLGQVKISAPLRVSLTHIREFVTAHLDWIDQQQQKIRAQQIDPQLALTEQTHYYRGSGYALQVEEHHAVVGVVLRADSIILQVPPRLDAGQHKYILEQWYHRQLLALLAPLIGHWEQQLQVSVVKFSVRQMKTRWGSCTPGRRTLRFNLELVKRSPACLEYVVVHELVHLLEPSHNKRFRAFMDKFLPQWRECRAELNSTPRKHEC